MKTFVLAASVLITLSLTQRKTVNCCLCVQKIGSKELGHLAILVPANDGSSRMFVVEENGTCYIVYPDGDFLPEPFFKIGPHLGHHITTFSHSDKWDREPVVSGMALHPNFQKNGLFYLVFTKSIDDMTGERITTLGEFKVLDTNGNKTDPQYFQRIFDVYQPFYNLYSGQILFGPEGNLYVFFGDGGGTADPFEYAQDMTSLLGKVLRIDVDNTSGDQNYSIPYDNPFLKPLPDGTVPRPEIYAYGLRNPYRCGIDSGDQVTGADKGRIICGDIGESKINELDLIKKGVNYGWNKKEGTRRFCFRCQTGIEGLAPTDPIYEYNRTVGRLVVGGQFYRGCGLSDGLHGSFIYGDHWSGKLFYLTKKEDGSWTNKNIQMCGSEICNGELTNNYSNHIYSFGLDHKGEIYLLTSTKHLDTKSPGYIYKLVDPFGVNCGSLENDQEKFGNLKEKAISNNIPFDNGDMQSEKNHTTKEMNNGEPVSQRHQSNSGVTSFREFFRHFISRFFFGSVSSI